MRTTRLLIRIALIGLWLGGLAAYADAFLYELSFNQAIGTRTFGRLAGAKDGYEDLHNGDSPIIKGTPDTIDGYDSVYFQGSGMIEASTFFWQLHEWTLLGRDIKNPDGAASTWVLVVDEDFFTESGLSQLSMTWKLAPGYDAPAGTLELVRPNGTVAVGNMKGFFGPMVFAKTPSGSQLGPGRYEIRYRKVGITKSAPATPEPIEDEMPWIATRSQDVDICPLEAGKTVQLIPGQSPNQIQIRVFRGGAAAGVATGVASVSSSGQWRIRYTLPDAISIMLFDQVVIGYRITTSYGSADSYVTITKSGAGNGELFKDMEIVQGWNLLAAPLELSDGDDSGFSDLVALRPLTMGSAIRAYVVLSQRAQTAQCRAFWVFSSFAQQIALKGSGAVSPSLRSGWNFTGVADDTKSVAELGVTSAWRWDSVNNRYVHLGKDTVLQSGVGYWLYRQ